MDADGAVPGITGKCDGSHTALPSCGREGRAQFGPTNARLRPAAQPRPAVAHCQGSFTDGPLLNGDGLPEVAFSRRLRDGGYLRGFGQVANGRSSDACGARLRDYCRHKNCRQSQTPHLRLAPLGTTTASPCLQAWSPTEKVHPGDESRSPLAGSTHGAREAWCPGAPDKPVGSA